MASATTIQESLMSVIADAIRRADPAMNTRLIAEMTVSATGLRRAAWATFTERQKRTIVRKAQRIVREDEREIPSQTAPAGL